MRWRTICFWLSYVVFVSSDWKNVRRCYDLEIRPMTLVWTGKDQLTKSSVTTLCRESHSVTGSILPRLNFSCVWSRLKEHDPQWVNEPFCKLTFSDTITIACLTSCALFFPLLYSTILRSRTDSLRSCWNEWLAFYSALWNPPKWCGCSAVWSYMAGATQNCCHLGAFCLLYTTMHHITSLHATPHYVGSMHV